MSRRFQAGWQRRQDEAKPSGQDLAEALHELTESVHGLAQYLGARDTELHQQVGVADHHEAVVQAGHGLSADLSLPAAFAALYVVKQLTDVVDFVNEQQKLIGEKTLGEIGANISEMWDKFKDGTAQVIDEAQQRLAELASPELASPELASPELASPELASPEVAPKAQDQPQPDQEMAALLARQQQELASQDAQIKQQQEKFAGSPENLAAVNEVAKVVQDQTAARHAAEVQKLMEQRAIQQQQLTPPPRTR